MSNDLLKAILKHQLIKYIIVALIINLIITIMLFTFISEDDFAGIPTNKYDKFITLFHYCISIFSTIGNCEIYPRSSRAKLLVSSFMMFISAGIISMLHSHYEHIIDN